MSETIGGRRTSSHSKSRLLRSRGPGSQGSRSRPTSPLVQSRPSSPLVYSPPQVNLPQQPLQQQVYLMQPNAPVSGTVIVGVQQPWHIQPASITTTPQLSTVVTHMTISESLGSVPNYQQQTIQYAAMVPGYRPPIYPSPHPAQISRTQHPANYYAGPPYIQRLSSRPGSRPTTPDVCPPPELENHPSVDMEDISLRPRGLASSRLKPSRRQENVDDSPASTSDTSSTSDASVTPSLRFPVSSLPSPLDEPGIPIQDEVCPFHERQSEWLATPHCYY